MLNLQKYMVCRTEMLNLDWTLKDFCLTTTKTSFVDILWQNELKMDWLMGWSNLAWNNPTWICYRFLHGRNHLLWSEKGPFHPAAKPTPSSVPLSSSSSRLVSLSSLSSSISKSVSLSSSSSLISFMPISLRFRDGSIWGKCLQNSKEVSVQNYTLLLIICFSSWSFVSSLICFLLM